MPSNLLSDFTCIILFTSHNYALTWLLLPHITDEEAELKHATIRIMTQKLDIPIASPEIVSFHSRIHLRIQLTYFYIYYLLPGRVISFISLLLMVVLLILGLNTVKCNEKEI